MLRSDVSEKVGNTQSLNAITEVVNVLSIHFAFVKPFINAWNELGFSCENDNVSVFIGTAGFNVAIGDDYFVVGTISELNELITNRNK